MRLKSVRYALRFLMPLILISLTIVACKAAAPQAVDSTPTLAVEPDADTALGHTCTPPCWLDIQPGVTTMQEARATLERYSDQGIVERWREVDWDRCPEITVWPVGTPSQVNGANLLFRSGSDTVYRIDAGPFSFYTLGQLVDRYGPPEFVSDFGCSMCSDCSTAAPSQEPGQELGQSIKNLMVYYPSRGMMFYLQAPLDMIGCMCPDMVVHTGGFFAPMNPAEFLNPQSSSASDSYCELFLQIGPNEPVIEWHGFGPGYSSDTFDSCTG